MVDSNDCLFCSIVSGSVPADVVHRDERTVAFRDINPQAPVHVLVVPTRHITSLDTARADEAPLLGALLLRAAEVARQEGIDDSGYRTVVNTGEEGGQTVGHLHVHVLGGRGLSWPPG